MPSLPGGCYQGSFLCWGSYRSDEQRLFVDWTDLHSLYSAVTYAYVERKSRTPVLQLRFQSVGS